MSKTPLFKKEAKFIAGADTVKRIPFLRLPEIAFIGKSNVGKSSLVNSLCHRKSLARVSHTPGRTQQINFFQIGESCTLVDLPGYGFAKVPKSMKKTWEELILHYLGKRDNLKIVNLLIDARRGVASHDMMVIDLLNSLDRPFQIIFTKSDKISDRAKLIDTTNAALPPVNQSMNFIFTSTRSKDGTRELQSSLARAITQNS
ncbi:MAG: ribosome biogenesis GTP-binding protein YihA/YsxC [Pseudomonadota bacterium]